MKIVLISKSYPLETGIGGIPSYTYNLAHGLSLLGHEVHVVTQALDEEKVYCDATIFAMPSYGDPFPNVFFEAMINQVPCIGTNISGMPEQVKDGKTGFIIEHGDTQMLADKIIYLLKNKDVANNMGSAGYDHVMKNFTWDKVVERMDRELCDILT
ncbi:MAG: glycosyltransferase family 4 protein [Candidatus Omnitrophica bacterium]|nr:glycosyltransferase family 4 protein [Candidatus Omnitrophota bacterium]